MIIVLLLTVFVNLITAVLVGIFIKNLVTISRLSEIQLDNIILTNGLTEIEKLSDDEANLIKDCGGKVILLKIRGPISYGVGRGLVQRFNKIEIGEYLVVDLSEASIVGISAILVIEQIVEKSQRRGVKVKFINMSNAVQTELHQLDQMGVPGQENLLSNLSEALAEIKNEPPFRMAQK